MKKLKSYSSVGLVAAATLLSGCFTYKPVELASLPEGGQVRVHLTRQGFASLPEATDLTRPRLAGKLVSRASDQVTVRVPHSLDGSAGRLGQDYVIPARDVLVFERREFNRTRTVLAVAGGLATATALYLTFEKGKPFSRDNSEQPEEEEPGFRKGARRVVGWSIPIR